MLFWEGHAALDAGSVVSKWPSAMGPSGSALVAEKSLTQVIHIASGAEVRAKGRPSWLMGVILTSHLTPELTVLLTKASGSLLRLDCSPTCFCFFLFP